MNGIYEPVELEIESGGSSPKPMKKLGPLVAKKKKSKGGIRRVRCHECKGCTAKNCDQCRFCLDMPRNGGHGKLRQSCVMRFCQNVSIKVHCKSLSRISTLGQFFQKRGFGWYQKGKK